MIEGIEPLYRQIAESIEEAIHEEWISAKIYEIFYYDSITFFGEYVRQCDGRLKDFGTGRAAQRAFRDIRKKFKEAGQPVWGQACFELHSDGKFVMTWGYENCDDNGATRFDEESYVRQDEERRRRLNMM